MDTKWKKGKAVFGVAARLLGIGMLLFVLACNPYRAFRWELWDLKEIMSPKGRYERTEAFRDYVSEMLCSLIQAGAGKPVLAWTVEAEETGRRIGGAVFTDVREALVVTGEELAEEEAEVTEGGTVEEWPGTAGFWKDENDVYWPQKWDRDWTDEEIEKMRQNFWDAHFEDKNLLYEVTAADKDGAVVTYSNTEGLAIGKKENALPEAYGFLLQFDGKKASAWLEGEELDLYGDGIYRWERNQWSIPGFDNYRMPDDWKPVTVVIAVRRVPVRYTVNTTVYGGRLYRVWQNLQDRHRFFILWLAACVGAAVLLLAGHMLRKERREAARRFGKTLKTIPFEAVMLLTVGSVLAGGWRFLFWLQYWDSPRTGALFLYGGLVLVMLWVLYAYLLYGNQPWKNSVTGWVMRLLRGRAMRMDIQRRISRRVVPCICLLASGIAMGAAAWLLCNVFYEYAVGEILFAIAFAVLLAALVLLACNGHCQWKLAADLGILDKRIAAAYEGKREEACELPADSELAGMASKVAGIRDGLEKAVEERMHSEQMKVDLVANVSHDIKTPLTSIISYVDLLKEDESLPEELKDYVEVLSRKSERLREMVQDVFEVSKATSGQLPMQFEKLDLAKLLRQTMADMQEQIDSAPVSVRVQIPRDAVEIMADGQRLYRVFQNLLQNALLYSLEGSRVYVKLEREGSLAVASVRNTSKTELDGSTDFTERFVRGDESRTDGGSGLGLSIAKSFTEACKGTFRVETIADLFVVTVTFPAQQ